MILSTYRRALMLLLFAATLPLTTIQAGPFARWLLNWVTNTCPIAFSRVYPLNMGLASFSWAKFIVHEVNTPVDNATICKTYPHACAYVQQELEKVGIDPAHVRLVNADELLSSKSGHKTLQVTLSILEAALDDRPKTDDIVMQGNRAKEFIAHEIGHLKNHSSVWSMLVPLMSLAGTHVLAYHCSPMRYGLMGVVLKTFCSQALVNAWTHYDEYCADTHAIKHFKHESDVLLDAASFWLSHHQQEVMAFHKTVAAVRTEEDTQKSIVSFFYNPMRNTVLHWIVDSHGSHLLRANRLLKAAGLPSTPGILARELFRQHAETPGKCDIQRIKTILENIDTLRVPEVFKFYWQ